MLAHEHSDVMRVPILCELVERRTWLKSSLLRHSGNSVQQQCDCMFLSEVVDGSGSVGFGMVFRSIGFRSEDQDW